MMKIFLVFFLLLTVTFLYGEQSEKRILVQKIEAVGVDPAIAKSIEEAILLDIGKRKGFSVLTPAEMEVTLKNLEAGSEMGCESSSECLVEVQKKLAASDMISGKAGKFGNEFVLSLSLIDVKKSVVGKRASIQGKDIDDMKKKVSQLLDELLGVSAPKQLFSLKSGEKLKLAVMPLKAYGIEQSTADALTQILSSELNQIEGVSVISQDDIKAMLAKVTMETQLACLDNLECVVEIGSSLGLSKLVTGSVGKVKDNFVLSLQLIDTRRAEVENRVMENFTGEADELRNAVKLASYQLVGVDYSVKKGGVDFTFNIAEAELQLGEKKDKVKESQYKEGKLLPGRYYLTVIGDSDKYLPFQTDIYVAPGSTNVKNFSILEKPTPWYKTWWFWTITGAVVASATATTIYLLQQEQPAPSGNVSGQ